MKDGLCRGAPVIIFKLGAVSTCDRANNLFFEIREARKYLLSGFFEVGIGSSRHYAVRFLCPL